MTCDSMQVSESFTVFVVTFDGETIWAVRDASDSGGHRLEAGVSSKLLSTG